MSDEQPFNGGEVAQVKKRARKAQIQRLRELDDLAYVMSDPRGRRVLSRVQGFCRVFESLFDANALVMAHREGQRNVGLWLTAEMTEAAPAQFLEMQREAAEPPRVEIENKEPKDQTNQEDIDG